MKEAFNQLYSIQRDIERAKSGNEEVFEEVSDDVKAKNLLRKESQELFGLFPPKKANDSKLIMIMFEICRLHQRQ